MLCVLFGVFVCLFFLGLMLCVLCCVFVACVVLAVVVRLLFSNVCWLSGCFVGLFMCCCVFVYWCVPMLVVLCSCVCLGLSCGCMLYVLCVSYVAGVCRSCVVLLVCSMLAFFLKMLFCFPLVCVGLGLCVFGVVVVCLGVVLLLFGGYFVLWVLFVLFVLCCCCWCLLVVFTGVGCLSGFVVLFVVCVFAFLFPFVLLCLFVC